MELVWFANCPLPVYQYTIPTVAPVLWFLIKPNVGPLSRGVLPLVSLLVEPGIAERDLRLHPLRADACFLCLEALSVAQPILQSRIRRV